jgi:hypothetical protein
MADRIRDCIQDIINLAEASTDSPGSEVELMKKRIDQFFSDLDRFKAEWPNQDVEQYVNRLDEK